MLDINVSQGYNLLKFLITKSIWMRYSQNLTNPTFFQKSYTYQVSKGLI